MSKEIDLVIHATVRKSAIVPRGKYSVDEQHGEVFHRIDKKKFIYSKNNTGTEIMRCRVKPD
jgi:hypothetical protein